MLPVGAEQTQELAGEGPLTTLAPLLGQVATRLETGRGFVLVRALPQERFAAPEAALLRLGAALGQPLGQGAGAVGLLESPAGGRLRLRFHADAADIVALWVLTQPPEVDPAMLVAAASVHNALMLRDRAALELLHLPYPHLLPDGRVAALPVFSSASGAFTGRYARSAIEAAQRRPEVPRLSAAQMAALDLLDMVAAEPGLALRIDVRPGDLLLFNPLLVWKRRAEAEPDAEQGRVRQALRLLLVTPNSRAVPGGLLALDGVTDQVRG
jgi:hypothetical protein